MESTYAKTVLIDFARMLDKSNPKHPCFYSYILAHENSGELIELSKEEQKHLRDVRRCTLKPKANHCFMNAQSLALSDTSEQIKYHEGFITISDKIPVPIEHAWNSLNGKIIDITHHMNWLKYDKPKQKPKKPFAYCGVQLDKLHIIKAQLAVKVYTMLTPYAKEKRFEKFFGPWS